MALPTPPPYTNPIPNNPFYAPLNPYVCGPYFPVALGNGIDLTTATTVPTLVNDVACVLAAGSGITLTTFLGVTTITATGGGGGGSGTVTSITAGTGLSGGTITTSGTIALCCATTSAIGGVKPDGSTVLVAADGTISVPTATPTQLGLVRGRVGTLMCTSTSIGLNALAALPVSFSVNDNTAIGNATLQSLACGVGNTALGSFAGSSLVGTGLTPYSNNTFLGSNAAGNLTSGCDNVFIGANAVPFQTGGCNNIAIGSGVTLPSLTGSCQLAIGCGTSYWLSGDSTLAIKPGAGIIDCAGSCGTAGQALLSNGANAVCWGTATAAEATPTTLGTLKGCTFTNYVALGCDAAVARTTGSLNVAIGVGALCSATTGSINIAIGNCALKSMVSVNNNVAIGFASMCAATAGALNTAVGNQTMTGAIGNSNTAIGNQAMRSATGSTSVAVGNNALFTSSGTQNVALGNLAGSANTTGSCNTFVGFGAGSTVDTGCCNLFIGTYADVATDVSCCLYIGIGGAGGTPLPWLTGDSTAAIKPGAGIIDCASSTGTNGQVLLSNGANAVCWGGGVSGTYTFGTCTVVIINGLITSVT